VNPKLAERVGEQQGQAKLRRPAAKRGLDPNQWFGNVELVAADVIGRETVQYVSNILKYYVVCRRLAELGEERAQARNTALRPALSRTARLRCSPRRQTGDEHRLAFSFTAPHGIREDDWLAEAGVGERVAAWPTMRSSLRAKSSRAIRSSVRAS
jgi:hypothetical protein